MWNLCSCSADSGPCAFSGPRCSVLWIVVVRSSHCLCHLNLRNAPSCRKGGVEPGFVESGNLCCSHVACGSRNHGMCDSWPCLEATHTAFTKTVESVILESAIYVKPNSFPVYAVQIPRFKDSRARFDTKFGAHSQIPRFQDSGWPLLQCSLPLSKNPRLRSPTAAALGQEV